ncbi:hypothetical protein JCM37173_26480 [Allocoprococcus similis]|nr:hypothetical protein [Coprococcus comes]
MRYKVGDKVKVRSDLKENIRYGGQIFVRDMAVHCGKNVEISKVYDDAYCIKESDREWFWTDEMFEGLAEDELTAEEAIKVLADMCTRECKNCELGKLVKESRYSFCSAYRREHPDKVVEILKQWKEDHEKKEIEVELAYVVRVIEDTGKVKRCVYEEDVTEVKEEAMKRVLKEYCKEHEGKFFTVYEEICRVKE